MAKRPSLEDLATVRAVVTWTARLFDRPDPGELQEYLEALAAGGRGFPAYALELDLGFRVSTALVAGIAVFSSAIVSDVGDRRNNRYLRLIRAMRIILSPYILVGAGWEFPNEFEFWHDSGSRPGIVIATEVARRPYLERLGILAGARELAYAGLRFASRGENPHGFPFDDSESRNWQALCCELR